ncbi:MAG: hypothetical protein ACRD1Z_04815 [Vicinamibacteria bacterium]
MPKVIGKIKAARISFAEAERKLRQGVIDGFSYGYAVVAKRDTYLVHRSSARPVKKGTLVLTKTDRKAWYGVMIGRKEWSARKKDFWVADKVVHETWVA